MTERKPLTEEQKESARVRSRAHYYANKEKKLAYQKKYRQENKKTVAAAQKNCISKNPEKYAARKSKYYQENKEKLYNSNRKWIKAHPEREAAYGKKWRQANPERVKARDHRRRARVAKVGGKFTKEDINNLYATQQARCYYCSVGIEEKYHIDHMHPLSREGSNWPENLCLTCVPCNLTKNTKTAEEFIEQKGFMNGI